VKRKGRDGMKGEGGEGRDPSPRKNPGYGSELPPKCMTLNHFNDV